MSVILCDGLEEQLIHLHISLEGLCAGRFGIHAVIAKLHGVCWVEGKNRHIAVPGGTFKLTP